METYPQPHPFKDSVVLYIRGIEARIASSPVIISRDGIWTFSQLALSVSFMNCVSAFYNAWVIWSSIGSATVALLGESLAWESTRRDAKKAVTDVTSLWCFCSCLERLANREGD